MSHVLLRSHRLRIAAVVSAVALVGAFTSAGAAAPAAVPAADSLDGILPDVAASSTVSGAAITSGQLAEGTARAGVPVVLMADPNPDNIGMAIDDSYEMVPIAKTVTDADGRYVLRSGSPTGLRSVLAGTTAPVSMQVMFPSLPDEPSRTVQTTSADITAGTLATPTSSESVDTAEDAAPEDYSGSSGPPKTIDPPPVALKVAAPASLAATASEPASTKPKVNTCKTWFRADLGKRATRVGQTWSKTKRGVVQFTYTSGKNKGVTLGVAVLPYGGSGWKFEKTVSKEFSSTTEYTATKGIAYTGYVKNTTVHRIETWCVFEFFETHKFEAVPVAISGSSVLKLANPPNPTGTTRCDSYYNGKLTVDHGKNTTYTNGLSTSSAIGIDLSSQSGYHAGTNVVVSSTDNKALTICATFGLPESAATGDIVVK